MDQSSTSPGGASSTIKPRKTTARRYSPLATNLVNLAPLLAVLMFLLAISAVFGYLHLAQTWQQQETLRHDANYAQQSMRLHLDEQGKQLALLASKLAHQENDTSSFVHTAQPLLVQHPELLLIAWIDADGHWRTSTSQAGTLLPQASAMLAPDAGTAPTLTPSGAGHIWYRVHVHGPKDAGAAPMMSVQVPISLNGTPNGEVSAIYDLASLLRHAMPRNVAARYATALVGDAGQVLSGQGIAPRTSWLRRVTGTAYAQEVALPVLPATGGLVLRVQAWPASGLFTSSATSWLLLGLFALIICLLIANWHQSSRGRRALHALQTETCFRRTLESSMRTGLRVLDLDGRISYVNPAFCEMTGWTEGELLGQRPPFPYWPPEQHASLHQRLQNELRGGATASSSAQVSLRRKNGSLFEARLYMSPMIDSDGLHTGWMASVTDITEPNRIRWQLTAARKRFTTVLEALGSSVSVASIGGVELLFANKLYRQWFGDTADGHLRMALKGAAVPQHTVSVDDRLDQVDSLAGLPLESLAAETPDDHAEIYLERLGKWVEVRSRYLHWVDGRLVQMIIATDVTARHEAEERAAVQAEHSEAVNRLVTMGEMASSVAHELNQPLTAISNYCTGALSRLKQNRMSPQELQDMLNKTVHQAQRAGQVIRHIRGFVKRSAPRRHTTPVQQIVGQVVDLAETDLRRRNIVLESVASPHLPPVYADPLLIEQVLMNLIRNGADAIDAAGRHERLIRLAVTEEQHDQATRAVRFAVTDTGTGLAQNTERRLYEPFFSTKTDGMGIGLSLCRSIVESHQGRIMAQNLYNKSGEITGCCFAFWLPTSGYPQPPEPTQTQTSSQPILS